MSSPLEFLATLNISLVAPLESILFPIVGSLVIITALWSISLGPLRGRPDLVFPALLRSLVIAALIFASPYVGTLLLSGWSIAYSTGYNAAKQSLDQILERGNDYFSTMGLIAGGVGIKLAERSAAAAAKTSKEWAEKTLKNEVLQEVSEEAYKKGWDAATIQREYARRLEERITPEAIEERAQKEMASGKTLSSRMDKALNYANWVGVPLLGTLWLFYILGLSTGLTVILLKLAWPIGLAVLALSPRSGSVFMARWVNFAISALATALLVPMIVGLAAQVFVGGPVEEVLHRWQELAQSTSGGGFFEWLKNAFALAAVSIWSALLILGGLVMLFIVGGISATAVPTVIGQALISTGLFETMLVGRAAVGLLPTHRNVGGTAPPGKGGPGNEPRASRSDENSGGGGLPQTSTPPSTKRDDMTNNGKLSTTRNEPTQSNFNALPHTPEEKSSPESKDRRWKNTGIKLDDDKSYKL